MIQLEKEVQNYMNLRVKYSITNKKIINLFAIVKNIFDNQLSKTILMLLEIELLSD